MKDAAQKPHIHFHSDCPYFGGCENMLVNFFSDERLMERFRVTFSYRYSLSYEAGFRRRVKKDIDSYPLGLLDITALTNRIAFAPFRLLAKALSRLFLVKYWFVLLNTLMLYGFFRKEKIDMLHINNGGYPGAYSCMSAVFAARLRRVSKIIYIVNNVAFPYAAYRRWLDYPFDRMVARSVSLFVTGSLFAGQKLKEVLRLDSSKLIAVHNGISPASVTEPKAEVLRRLDVKDSRAVFAVVAALEERKGHVYLFEALKLLKKEDPAGLSPVVLLAGSGPLRESLIKKCNDAGLSDTVRFIGTEDNIFNLLNAVDALILPSISHEDFPFAVLEAMAIGKAIIASRICGIPEQIIHMESGILVEPKDVRGLAEAIRTLLGDVSLRQALGMNAKKRFNVMFRADVSIGKYIELYNKLLTAAGRHQA